MNRKSTYIDNKLNDPIVFYCKDCDKMVDVKPVGRKFVYKCGICNTKNVAFGTEKSISSFYRLEESEQKSEKEEPDENTEQAKSAPSDKIGKKEETDK